MFYAWILIFFWLQLKLHWHCFWSIILYLLVEYFCVDLARHFRIKLKLSLYFYFAIKSVRDWNAVSHFFSLRLVPFRQPLSSFNTEKALSLKHTKQKKKQKKQWRNSVSLWTRKWRMVKWLYWKLYSRWKFFSARITCTVTVSNLSDEKGRKKTKKLINLANYIFPHFLFISSTTSWFRD